MTLIERGRDACLRFLGKVWPNLSEARSSCRRPSATARRSCRTGERYYPGIGAHLRLLYANVAAGKPPPVEAEEGLDVARWYDEILRQAGLAVGRGSGDHES